MIRHVAWKPFPDFLETESLFLTVVYFFFTVPAEDNFCTGKFDGFYDDPNNCTMFYQCLNGRATKRQCLKGMVFNALLKTCDTPQDFPCRTTEGADTVQLEPNRPEVKPTHRQGMDTDRGQSLTNLAAGAKMSA